MAARLKWRRGEGFRLSTRVVQLAAIAFAGYCLWLPSAAIHTGFYARRSGQLIFGGKFIILVPILILVITQWRLRAIQYQSADALASEWQLLTPQALLLVILIALQLL